jgi:hypothetical protein
LENTPPRITTYFAGAGAAGAGAAVSVAGAGAGAGAGFASSLAGAGACSEGPQATKEKPAKNEIATNKTKSFFIVFTSFLLGISIPIPISRSRSSFMHILQYNDQNKKIIHFSPILPS